MEKNSTSDHVRFKRGQNGSEVVKAAVLAFDFALLNLLLLLLNHLLADEVPAYIDTYTKFTVFVMNFALLVSEYFYHTIIERRLVTLGAVVANTIKLVGLQVILSFLSLRLLSDGTGFFRYTMIFGCSFFVAVMLSRIIEFRLLRLLRERGRNSQTVLFVGSAPALLRLYQDLTMSAAVGYRVLGYYADRPMANCPAELKRIGNMDDLNRQLDAWDANPLDEIPINEVFCSLPHDEGAQVKRIMRSCDKSVVRFFYVPRIFEDYEMSLKVQHFGNYIVFTNHLEPLGKTENRIIKRLFDLVVSAMVCVFLVPLTLVVGLIIKLQSPGPIFFRQGRTGIDGKTFYCYKFRSMHVNKDSDSVQATMNDPRKFPFGNFMRKSNIDELPQFFNVLLGDMSIVGPRPHMLHHTEVYGKLIDKYMVRHFCRPGITGWAQVTGFRGETQELWQMEERVKRDIWYIEHWSLLLDLRIMWLTTKSIFVHDKHAY